MDDRTVNLIQQASETPFYKEVLIPELDRRLAFYDDMMTTEVDPWKRYGYVEAYNALKRFKLALMIEVDSGHPLGPAET